MSILPNRIEERRVALELSQAELGRLSGTSQASIQRMEAGDTLNPRNLLSLARVLQTTPEYLQGETDDPRRPMLEIDTSRPSTKRDEDQQLDIAGNFSKAAAVNADLRIEQLVELDQIDLKYGMGGTYTDGPVEVEKRAFSREWLQSITTTPPRHLFWATGDGDSMEPTIRSGEIVLIDRSQETPRVDDAIWAVVDGEIGMIKRLRHHSDGTVELLSDNPLVPPRKTVDGELHVIGRVIAVVRRL